jgi:hypothetical protein
VEAADELDRVADVDLERLLAAGIELVGVVEPLREARGRLRLRRGAGGNGVRRRVRRDWKGERGCDGREA